MKDTFEVYVEDQVNPTWAIATLVTIISVAFAGYLHHRYLDLMAEQKKIKKQSDQIAFQNRLK